METETRTLTATATELRASDDGKLTGYAAVYNKRSENLGGFVEVIQPGAFDGSLSDDIRALVEHGGTAIARTSNGTLELGSDNKGLRVSIDPPDTTAGRDIRESVRRGDVDAMSFGFSVREGGQVFSEDDDGLIVRTLTDIRLFEVSIVTFPAYTDTTIATRSVRSWQDAHGSTSLAEMNHRSRTYRGQRLALVERRHILKELKESA